MCIVAPSAGDSPIILPLTLLLIVGGVLIMILNERELKEFLGHSDFGMDKSWDRFQSFDEEQNAYSRLGA
ncbi:hypothetical protein J2803_006163 [Paraburkholderia phenoliruptrix]|nr:hypothetical protein [Paraburkholderia phenoliruptrix]